MLLSQSKFAALHGVSRKTATLWKQQKLLVLQDGRVDVERSDEKLRRAGRGRFAPGTPDRAGNDATESEVTESLDLIAERARVARATAIKLERENELAAGDLVRVSDVAEVFGQQCAMVRNALLAIPRERAALLHRCKTPAELEAALRDAIHGALEALSSEAGDRLAKGPASRRH